MVENAKQMRCGGCGHDSFKIYQEAEGLVAECCDCKSTSTIRVSAPRIEIDFGKGSDGVLAVF